MNDKTVSLIIALLPLAEELAFIIGGKIVKLNTSDLTDQESIVKAFEQAKTEGFPALTFQ